MLNLNNQQDENEVNNHKKKEHLNEMQEKCVEQLDGFVLVLAGAGTGKTKVLISRFLSHIKNGIYPNEILCITFSNKAAYEIQKRIEQHLPEIEGLWAGTFHKICFRLLQMYGNLPSNISIIDEYDQKNIADKLDIMNFLKDIQLHTENLLLDQSSDFLRAYEKYQAFITQNNLIDFGGIIKKTVEMIDKNPHIKEIIQNKFKYIMVDEYQDTSKMQNYLIASMAKENLFCVGDDDQSIYGWRGACVKNILEFQKNFPNSKIFRLEQNYRSTCEILSVANHIIQQNNNRMRKEIWTEKTGSKVKICCTKYEPQYIAGEIKNLPENETVGILVRSSSLIKPIEVALVKYDIPYKVIGGYNFFEKLEIKTAIAYLKAVFFEDILSIERILATPKKGIGPIKLKKTLQQIQHGLSFSSALRELGCADFSEKIRYWKSLIDEKPAKIMKIIWEESGCDDLFHDRVENITILMEKLNQFNTITDFLTNFFTINTEEEARISIMTIHKSKGLEFDNVFIPGWIEGVFPNGRSIVEGNLEEERRLAYVSVTRAKKQLFLSYNLSQSTYKNNMFGSSRFLFNLPQKSVDFAIM